MLLLHKVKAQGTQNRNKVSWVTEHYSLSSTQKQSRHRYIKASYCTKATTYQVHGTESVGTQHKSKAPGTKKRQHINLETKHHERGATKHKVEGTIYDHKPLVLKTHR